MTPELANAKNVQGKFYRGEEINEEGGKVFITNRPAHKM